MLHSSVSPGNQIKVFYRQLLLISVRIKSVRFINRAKLVGIAIEKQLLKTYYYRRFIIYVQFTGCGNFYLK